MTFTLHNDDCLVVLKTFPDNYFDAIITDPPYHLTAKKTGEKGFMGQQWDGGDVAFRIETWAEVLRVLKPGGHLLAFSASRTYHRMAVAVEDAGFEIRDQIMWLYGCLSSDTEILVDGVWMNYTEIREGQKALCFDAHANSFQWETIARRVVYDYDDTAYRIQSARTDQLVSKNHRVLIERNGTHEFVFAEILAQEHEARVPVLEDMSSLLVHLSVSDERASGAKYRVPSTDMSTGTTEAETQKNQHQVGADFVQCVRSEDVEVSPRFETSDDPDVFSALQRDQPGQRVGETCPQGSGGMDESNPRSSQASDDRLNESLMEGWSDPIQNPRQLQGSPLRAVPGDIEAHVPQGRLCDGASDVRGTSSRTLLESNRSSASQGSRPDEQCAIESGVISEQQGTQAVRASRFTTSDLARITPVHYSGQVWCVQVPSGAFVARRNGQVFVTGNSGFPKSMDIAKQFDKNAGAERTVLGESAYAARANKHPRAMTPGNVERQVEDTRLVTEPSTDLAQQWDGWGTALKPAHEPIVMARKPLIGTVITNVEQFGTGGINIDDCRVEAADQDQLAKNWDRSTIADIRGGNYNQGVSGGMENTWKAPTNGRWPANVIHDGSEEVEDEFAKYGITKSTGGKGEASQKTASLDGYVYGGYSGGRQGQNAGGLGDSGSVSRFFYCAKASKKDREEGLDELRAKSASELVFRKPNSAGMNSPRAGAGRTSGEIVADKLQLRDDLTPEELETVTRELQSLGIEL